MSRSRRRAILRPVGAGAMLLAFVVPAAASASQVPAVKELPARFVASGPSTQSRAVQSVPLRPKNAAQYAQQKAAADRSYQHWAAQHPQPFGPGLTIGPATITELSKPGLGAAASGGVTPPDTTGAIGPSNYLEFVNSRLGLYNRTTLTLSSSV